MAAKSFRVGRIRAQSSALFVCDVQERFRPLIDSMNSVVHVSKLMLRSAEELKIPIIVSEQYPKALGKTVPELDISKAQKFDKMQFSMVIPEVEEFLRKTQPKSVLICGIEAHVCVQQTVLDLLDRGYDVHVLADGVSSQRLSDRMIAIERMRHAGAFVTTSESALFEMMTTAEFPNFKAISTLLKENKPPASGLYNPTTTTTSSTSSASPKL